MKENRLFPYVRQFNQLNESRQAERSFRELSIWPRDFPPVVSTVKSNEYWALDKLMTCVGQFYGPKYDKIQLLDAALCNQTPRELSSELENVIGRNHIHFATRTGIELTRYASWTLMKEISQYTPTAFQQEYFLSPNMTLAQLNESMRGTARIELRALAAKYQKQLNGILSKLIIGASRPNGSKYYATLNRYVIDNLCGGIDQYETRQKFAMRSDKPLMDYMDDKLLAAYTQTLKRVIDQWDFRATNRTYNTLCALIRDNANLVRKEFLYGVPEQHFTKEIIDKVRKTQQQRELAFARQYINTKIY